MIELSELAGNALVQSLEASGLEPEKGFRLTIKEDKFTLEIDSPADDDQVVRHEGAIALIVDQGTEEELGNVLIDVVERLDGPTLIVRSIGSKPSQE